MSSEDRRSAGNGIWMCYKHGKQIDNDECRFSSDILIKWKEVAERRAQIENELGRDIENEPEHLLSLGLARNNITITTANGSENELIGNALRDSCANALWGRGLVSYLRTYLIERVRNALRHGMATSVKLEIDFSKVVLIDDGDNFTHIDLLSHPEAKGGAKSKHKLLEKYGEKIISTSQRIGDSNHATIAILTSMETIKDITPCTVELTLCLPNNNNYNLDIIETCSEVYVTLPNFFSTSDLYWLHEILPSLNYDYRRLVFVLDEVADYIPEEIKIAYPDSRVINLSAS